MTIVNESTSWGYVEIPYITPKASHVHKIHIREIEADGTWVTPYLSEANIEATLLAYLNLSDFTIPEDTAFSTFTVYRNNPYPTPKEIFYLGTVPALTNAPSAAVHTAAQVTINLRTSLNKVAKLCWADVSIGVDPPWIIPESGQTADMTALTNYVLANNNIVTRKGVNITALFSYSCDINNVYSRRYGKADRTFP